MSDWIIEAIGSGGYVALFLLMLLESIFPPIPSELIIPFAGYVAAQGELNFFGVVAAATLGAVVGITPWYVAGRLFGLDRLRWLANRYGRLLTLNSGEIDLAVSIFQRYGPAIVFVGRLVPMVRTLISIPAGIARMPAHLFFLASAGGAFLWNMLLAGSGLLLHEHYHQVERVIDPLAITVLVVGVGVYLYRVITWRPADRP